MLCNVCREGLEGIWDPKKTKRLGQLRDFPEILDLQFEDGERFDGLPLEEVETYVFAHHTTHDSLLYSKEQGCASCAMFQDINDADDVNETLAKLGYYSVFCISLGPRPYQPRPMMLVYSGETLSELPHELVPNDGNDFINTALSSSTGSPETWDLVQNWLDRCLKEHEECRDDALPLSFDSHSSTFSPSSPTRLLELQTPPPLPIPRHLRPHRRPKHVPSSFRLLDRAQYPVNVKYITLSHCWGPGSTHTKLRLTKATEGELRRGLPVSVLPRTFRDAFEIVARLGVRYLWIDRLCIVQDSAADWAAEAGTMLGVYRGGFLNIAAMGSGDDEGGCFFDRDVKIAAPMAISLSPPSPDGAVGKRRRRDSKLDINDDPFAGCYYRLDEEKESWKVGFVGEPLLGRAWVLQERMLARRTLYFGRQQVYWECGGGNCCETMPNGGLVDAPRKPGPSPLSLNHSSSLPLEKSSASSAVGPPSKRSKTWKTLINPHEWVHSNLEVSWKTAVQSYSRCGLTFADDKLVALSGLAKQFAAMFAEEPPTASNGSIGGTIMYAAGLWLHTMPKSLLWKPKTQGQRPTSYRAPSWSWAALDGEIEFESSGVVQWHVEMIRVVTVPRGIDPMSTLSDGMVEVKGPLFIGGKLIRYKTVPPERDSYRFTLVRHPETEAPIDLDCQGTYLQFDAEEDYQDEVTVLIFFSRPNKKFSTLQVKGLALACVDRARSLYRRVGFMFTRVVIDFSDGDYENTFFRQFPFNIIKII